MYKISDWFDIQSKEDEKWMAQTRDHTAPFSHTTYCIISLCFSDPQKKNMVVLLFRFDWSMIGVLQKIQKYNVREWLVIWFIFCSTSFTRTCIWKCATFFCFKSISKCIQTLTRKKRANCTILLLLSFRYAVHNQVNANERDTTRKKCLSMSRWSLIERISTHKISKNVRGKCCQLQLLPRNNEKQKENENWQAFSLHLLSVRSYRKHQNGTQRKSKANIKPP